MTIFNTLLKFIVSFHFTRCNTQSYVYVFESIQSGNFPSIPSDNLMQQTSMYINYSSFYTITKEQVQDINLFQLFANFDGLIGVFVGYSIMSLVKSVDFMLDKLLRLKIPKEHRGMDNRKSHINSITEEVDNGETQINSIIKEVGNGESQINSITKEVDHWESQINSIIMEVDNGESQINVLTKKVANRESQINVIIMEEDRG